MPLTEKNIRNIFVYTVPRFLKSGLYLLTLPVLTRLLTPEDFGVIALALAFPTIAVGVVTAGLTASIQRFYFEYRSDKKKLNSLYCSTQSYLMLMLIISTFAVYLTKDYISELVTGTPRYGMAVLISYLSVYLGQLIAFFLRIYQNEEKAVLHSTFVIMQSVSSVGLSFLLVWHYKMTYMGMIYGSFAGALISFIAITVHFNKQVTLDFQRNILVDNIKYGLQVVPKTFTSFINRFFDKYMLNAMLSMSAAGIYNVGQTIANAVDMLLSNICMSFQPVYYRDVFDRGQNASSDVGRIFTIYSYISLLPVLLVVLFSSEVVHLIAPPSYYGAISIVVILSAGITTQVFGKFVGIQYAYSKKPFWIFPVSVIGTLINVGMNILLIPRYGLAGAGFATVASTTATNILLTVIGQKLYRIKYEWGTIIMLMGLVVFSMLFMLSLTSLNLSFSYIYLLKIFLIVLFILVGIKAKIITKDRTIKLYNRVFKNFNGAKA